MRGWTFTFTTALLASAAMSGCGSSGRSAAGASNGVASKSPQQIVAAALAAANGARSVHLAGSGLSASTPITLDLHLAAGQGGRGTVSENGLTFELVVLGPSVYVKGSPAFLRQTGGAAAAQLLAGKWLKAPSSNASFAQVAQLADIHKLFSATLGSHGTLAKGATTTVNGQPAVAVNDTTQGGTLYVATTGTPYPLEIAKSGTGAGKLVIDQWNEPVTLTPPPNAVDIGQLKAAK